MDPHEAAALARASMHNATVATLRTYPRLAPRPHLTLARVRDTGDGSPVVDLRPDACAVHDLLVRPFATVTVAPPGHPRVTLHGAAQRLPDLERPGLIAYRLRPGAIRLGDDEARVDVEAYVSGGPDPLHGQSAAVLDHLRGPGAADQLAACLRAHGHDARFAEPVVLDRHGITALAVGPGGVSTVRLPFPFPISDLSDLPGDLHVLLAPHRIDFRSP
jgi:hypothetical protein